MCKKIASFAYRKKYFLRCSKKPMRSNIILLSLCLLAASCDRNQSRPEKTVSFAEPALDEASNGSDEQKPASNSLGLAVAGSALKTEENGSQSPAVSPQEMGKKIIRTADIRMEVKNLEASTDAIERLLGQYGAYIGSSSYSSTNESRQNRLSIRVNSAHFDALMRAVSKEALFLNYKNINTQDVTMEFIDTEARLRNKKEVEQRYLSILRNQAKTVKDILAAEEQLRVIREEIEAREGQLRYLQNQVSLSTINLEIYEKTEYVTPPQPTAHSFFSRLLDALKNGWSFLATIVLALVSIWPLLLAGALSYTFWWSRRKKRKAD
jgi:hypothetical protein